MVNLLNFEKIKENLLIKIDEISVLYGDSVYIKYALKKESSKSNLIATIGEKQIILKRLNQYLYEYADEKYILYGSFIYKYSHNENTDKIETKIINSENEVLDIISSKNKIIEGENLLVLDHLISSNSKFSLICIDPPYNTKSKEMTYNDFFYTLPNGDNHSVWLSFMNERLKKAKELLSEDGVIFINIDEYEHAYLKLLCDNIFEENNFIDSFIWEKNSIKNNSKLHSNNHEYVLCYAKNKKNIENLSYFKKKKNGFEEVNKIVEQIKEDKSIINKKEEIKKTLNILYKSKKEYKGIKQYKFVEDNTLKVFRISDVSAPNGNGNNFDIIHPITNKVCKPPNSGYRYKDETIIDLLSKNRFYFGKTEATVPQYKRYLDEVETEVVKSVILNTDEGKKDLEKIFGFCPFNNAKPLSLLKNLISMINKKEMNCLDFFAGSGSFGHAILEFNEENNTSHSFVLITNNENNIFEDVTTKRFNLLKEKLSFDLEKLYLIKK